MPETVMKFSAAEITARADALYAARADLQHVRLSVELLQTALEQEFSYELGWRMGRALFFLGQETNDRAIARAFHVRAVNTCERAARTCPSRVEGHFWLGVNLALLAALDNPLRALRHALRARRSLRRAVALDPAYHAAGPLRVLARLEARLPQLLGGGLSRARANYEKALALAPTSTVTLLYFAELLLAIGDATRARQELETLLAAPLDPAWVFETARDRSLAQAMLQRLSPKSKVKNVAPDFGPWTLG